MKQTVIKLLLVFLLFQFSEKTFAQSPILLNINSSASNSEEDTYERMLNKLYFYDSIERRDSLNYYITEVIDLCSKIDTSADINRKTVKKGAEVYTFIADNFLREKNISEAIIYFSHAQKLYNILGDKKTEATCTNKIASIYLNAGNRVEALKGFIKAASLSSKTKDSVGMASAYMNIAKTYWKQGDLHRTQENLNKALKIVQMINEPDLLSQVIISIAGLKKEQGDLNHSLSLYEEALSHTQSNGDSIGMARTLNNIGSIYFDFEEYNKAKEFYDRANKILENSNCLICKAFVKINLSNYYLELGEPNKAIELSLQTLEIGKKLNSEELQTNSLQLLIKINEKQKNWEKAFTYQSLLIQQTLESQKNNLQQISQQETIRLKLEQDKYITRKKEIEQALIIEKENQRENIFYISVSVLFLLLITAIFIIYFRLRNLRDKNIYITKQSEERKLLLQEVHHRVKNNFQIVSSMLRLQSYNFEDEKLRLNFQEAVNRINAMAIVHDVIYRQEKFKDINSKTYLEKLVLSLHKTGDSRIKILIDSEEIPFKIETLISLGIALNELITNSFKHAFNNEIDDPKIYISLHTIGNKLYELNYKDNGIGIDKESYISNFGMDLIETIIDNFEGEIKLVKDKEWSTAFKITFREF